MFDLSALQLLLYLGAKFAAYVAWCALGVHYFQPHERPWRAGFTWGMLRLTMGFGVGLVVLGTVNALSVSAPQLDTAGLYAAVYIPTRVVEWGVLLLLMSTARGPGGRTTQPGRVAGWLGGGIALSCAADAPLFFILGGFPVGRVLC